MRTAKTVANHGKYRDWLFRNFVDNTPYDVLVATLIDPLMPGHLRHPPGNANGKDCRQPRQVPRLALPQFRRQHALRRPGGYADQSAHARAPAPSAGQCERQRLSPTTASTATGSSAISTTTRPTTTWWLR